MCLTGVFPEVGRLFHLSGERRTGQDVTEWSRKSRVHEKSLGGDFGRLPERQEGAGFSGVRQKDRRTLSWVESG